MKRLPVTLGLTVLLLSGFSYWGNQVYQKHLSGNLKRTLQAALDPAASANDIHAYIRDARLLVRTAKDAETLGEFQRAVGLVEDSEAIDSRVESAILHDIEFSREDYSQFDKLDEIRQEYWKSNRPVPKNISLEMHQALEDAKKTQERRDEQQRSDEKLAASEKAEAGKLLKDVRAVVGVPAI